MSKKRQTPEHLSKKLDKKALKVGREVKHLQKAQLTQELSAFNQINASIWLAGQEYLFFEIKEREVLWGAAAETQTLLSLPKPIQRWMTQSGRAPSSKKD